MIRTVLAIATVASCSPPAANPPAPRLREPDDVASGATVIRLVDNHARVRGVLDGPASETIDWFRVEGSVRPANTLATGTFLVEVTLIAGDVRNLEVEFFSGTGGLPASVEHTAAGYRYRVRANGTPMLARFWQEDVEPGSYELDISYRPDLDWLQLDVPPPPDLPEVPPPEKPFCKLGEIGDHCRDEACDWVKPNGKNPRCGPGMP